MKIINKITFAVSLFAMMGLASCSDKGYWDEAPAQQGYSFEQTTLNTSITPGDNTIPVKVLRSEAGSEVTLPVAFTPGKNCPATISVPSSITFAEGSNEATLNITVTGATPPQVYSGKIAFTGDVSYAGSSALEFTIPVEYIWENIGTGKYFDQFVMEVADPEGKVIALTDFMDVTILKAEGFERYRVMAPYTEYFESHTDDWFFAALLPEYVEFWEEANGSISWDIFNIGLGYDGDKSKPITAVPGNLLASNGGVTNYNMWAEPGYAMFSPFYWINGVGGYNNSVYPAMIQVLLPSYLAAQ